MGVILALLIATDHAASGASTPLWVVLAAHTAIGLGTLTGGWRIVKTMGARITSLQPVGGVAAESAAAATLFANSAAGIPVSTTHTITGGIMGVGAARRLSAVRWGVAGRVGVPGARAGWRGPRLGGAHGRRRVPGAGDRLVARRPLAPPTVARRRISTSGDVIR
jgi:hypothetical protein